MSNNIEKLPPQNIEAEQYLLGSLIFGGNKIKEVMNLKANDFYRDSHRIIFKIIKELDNCNVVCLADRLEEKKLLEKVGGRTYLIELNNTPISISNNKVADYVEIVRNKAILRQIIDAGRRIEEKGYNEEKDVYKLLEETKQTISNISKRSLEEEVFKVVVGEDILKMKIKEQPFVIDKLIPEKAITAITADAGKGKSILAMILAKHIAKGEQFGEFGAKKRKVLIVDQEMNRDTIIGRYKSTIREDINVDYLYENYLMLNIEKDYLWLIDTIKKNNYGVVIFDTLTTLHNKEENSSKEMREVNKLMLNLINQTGATIIYLHHHRKQRKGEQYNQATSRGSTEIIAKVASHLLIDSKREFDENRNIIIKMTISQEKNRLPECVGKIGLNIIYDPAEKKTSWEYIGEVDDKSQNIKEAKEFILEIINNGGEYTIKNFVEEKRTKGLVFGEGAIRDGCKELIEEDLLNSHKGEGKYWNTDYYFENTGE